MQARGAMQHDVVLGRQTPQLRGVVEAVEQLGSDAVLGEQLGLVLPADEGGDFQGADVGVRRGCQLCEDGASPVIVGAK